MRAHRIVVSDIFDDQRHDDAVGQLDTPCHINDFIPTLPIITACRPNNHQDVQVGLRMKIAARFGAEKDDALQVVPIARSQFTHEGRERRPFMRLEPQPALALCGQGIYLLRLPHGFHSPSGRSC